MTPLNDTLANAITSIAQDAGRVIMLHYHEDLKIDNKADLSPVTIADREANDLIVNALARLTPSIPIIAEESVKEEHLNHHYPEFWLVDPLDGTKEFIHRNGDFTVNIALVQNGISVMGVVYAPVHSKTYIAFNPQQAMIEDETGHRREIRAKAVNHQCPIVMVSKSHRSAETDQFLARYNDYKEISRGSSLKLCAVASGEADVYPRLGRTMEWDIAAGHAVLTAAGGRIETLDSQPLTYGKPGLANPHFVAWGVKYFGTK